MKGFWAGVFLVAVALVVYLLFYSMLYGIRGGR